MSEQDTGTPASGDQSQQPDPIHNVKQEFNRKLGNFETKISQLEQTNAALLQQLQAMTKPTQSAPAKSLSDVWLDNPDEAAAMVAEATEARVMSKLEAKGRESQTVAQLVGEFPELTDANHELSKKAVEIYSSFSAEDKRSPIAYRAAVKEAAMELGMVPKSKREQYEDDVAIRGTGNSRVRTERPAKGGKDIDPDTEEFARLVGLDIDNPKTRERIKKQHNRRSYTRWE